jgi:DNA recombination protein RmuC
MSLEIFIVIGVIVINFAVFLILIKKWINDISNKQNPNQDLLAWLQNTNTRLDTQNKQIVNTLQNSTNAINERLDHAAKFIASVSKNIGEFSEIGRGMKDLQDFLKSPKLRGNIGEQILKELLSQVLPRQAFHLQYRFRSGVIVDAAVVTGHGLIPIDSKFPLEAFQRLSMSNDEEERKRSSKEFDTAVKIHINAISEKYIVSDEGTLDYAVMYLPSESIYYEMINRTSLYNYATGKRVMPVSPLTFYAFLQAILLSFEGQKIESEAKHVLSMIHSIQKDYEKVEGNLLVLSKHMTNAYNQLRNVLDSFEGLGRKVTSSLLADKTRDLSKQESFLEEIAKS